MQNGKNDWQYWTTYIQDKNNTVWKATLNVAESANGVKYLYDIDPIEKVGPPVKSGTSTTGDIVAQNQTESQAQIRSSTLSDRDVLRIAAQMAKNSESMLDIKKNHPASSLFRAYNSVPAAIVSPEERRSGMVLRSSGLTIASRQLLRNGYIGSITYAGQNVNIKGLPFSSVVRLIGFQSISFPSRS